MKNLQEKFKEQKILIKYMMMLITVQKEKYLSI